MGRGSTTTETKIPKYLESAAKGNIARADQIAQIGYVPYYGPDVAAMTPMQMAAGGNINAAADAFGLGMPTSAGAGMPTAMDYGGMGAYSSGGLYDQALAELQQRAPAQFDALTAMFIDPVTGPRDGGLGNKGGGAAVSQPSDGGSDRDGRERIQQARERSEPSSFASSRLRSVLPGGVYDPFLERPANQAIARITNALPSRSTTPMRPVARPNRN